MMLSMKKEMIFAAVLTQAMLFASVAGAVDKPKVTYTKESRTCNVTLSFPPSVSWSVTSKCSTTAAADSQKVSSLKVAVYADASLPAPLTIATDENGQGLVLNGTEIYFTRDPGVTQEVSALHPPEPGFRWHGFRSAEIPQTSGPGEVTFTVEYYWEGRFPNASTYGMSWLSDDRDDRYGDIVHDSWDVFGDPANQNPNNTLDRIFEGRIWENQKP